MPHYLLSDFRDPSTLTDADLIDRIEQLRTEHINGLYEELTERLDRAEAFALFAAEILRRNQL